MLRPRVEPRDGRRSEPACDLAVPGRGMKSSKKVLGESERGIDGIRGRSSYGWDEVLSWLSLSLQHS